MKIFRFFANNIKNADSLYKDTAVVCLPDTAVLIPKCPFFIPDFTNDCRAQLCVAVRVNRLGKSIHERFAHRYYDETEISPAVHFVAQDRLQALQNAGLPWDFAVGFDNAVTVCFTKTDEFKYKTATLRINGETHQAHLDLAALKATIGKRIATISQLYTLRQGDVLLLPATEEIPEVHIDDKLTLLLDDREYLTFNVK